MGSLGHQTCQSTVLAFHSEHLYALRSCSAAGLPLGLVCHMNITSLQIRVTLHRYYLYLNLYGVKSGTNESVQLSIIHSSGTAMYFSLLLTKPQLSDVSNVSGYYLTPSPTDCSPDICEFFTVRRAVMVQIYAVIITFAICTSVCFIVTLC
jgi:hypothetical protein